MEHSDNTPEVTKALEEFFDKFDPPRDPKFWAKLILEESVEVAEAFANLLKEVCDLLYVVEGFTLAGGDILKDGEIPCPGAVLGALRVINREFDRDAILEMFRMVHQSNMSKLGPDGKPVRREDGKILKGPNYKAPDMLGFLERHYS